MAALFSCRTCTESGRCRPAAQSPRRENEPTYQKAGSFALCVRLAWKIGAIASSSAMTPSKCSPCSSAAYKPPHICQFIPNSFNSCSALSKSRKGPTDIPSSPLQNDLKKCWMLAVCAEITRPCPPSLRFPGSSRVFQGTV